MAVLMTVQVFGDVMLCWLVVLDCLTVKKKAL